MYVRMYIVTDMYSYYVYINCAIINYDSDSYVARTYDQVFRELATMYNTVDTKIVNIMHE